jgi:hypothetical protein
MGDQPNKKPYTKPELVRVQLDQEQAILTTCSLATNTVQNGGGSTCRQQGLGGCKNHNSGSGDSGPRLS